MAHLAVLGLVVAVAVSATLLPNRTTGRASGNVDPSVGLSFSGAVVVTQQTTLKQTLETTSFEAPAVSTNDTTNTEFAHAGLAGTTSSNEGGFSAGLLAPTDPAGVASSLSAENTEGSGAASEGSGSEGSVETASGGAVPANCDTSISSLYCVYEVQEGDTLSTIADLFGLVSTEDVANYELLVNSNKPDITSADDFLQPGQKIRVPLHNGTLHTVLTAETLTEIAEQHGVTIQDIMAVSANGISDSDSIGIGTEILIPNPTRFAPAFVPDETVAEEDPTATPDSGESSSDAGDSDGPAITGGGSTSGYGLIWPTSGPISSYYGPNHPLGIDIDLFNNSGAPISAVMGGVVTFAGGNPCCSYGYYVVIDHGNGYQSLYAHLSNIAVSPGEVVAQGQYLGGGGTTGYSTGDHLHFELQVNGSRVNPVNYLP